MIVRRFSVAVLAATLAVGACKGDPPPPPPPPPINQDSIDAANAARARARAEADARAEAARIAAERAAEAERTRAVAAARAVLEEAVFFDYDISDVRADQEGLLRRKAAILRASPQVQLRIEGHADDRGSTEYNMALGNRRASAVRDALTGFGLAESRFAIVSFGEERPSRRGSDERSWAANRRGEFVLTAGASAINPGN